MKWKWKREDNAEPVCSAPGLLLKEGAVALGANEIVVLIALMTLVTYLPRVLPVLLLSRRTLPAPVERWLSFVPVAVLSALLAPALFAPSGTLDLAFDSNPVFWVSIPVFLIAIKTRNLFMTVIAGMVMIALYRLLLL